LRICRFLDHSIQIDSPQTSPCHWSDNLNFTIAADIQIIKSGFQLKVHYYRHKMDDSAEEPVNDNRNIPEKLQNIPMSNKKIEAWKVQVAKEKSIFVASNVKSIKYPSLFMSDIVKKLKKRPFFWTIYKGESPTSILSHFLVGVCAPREVNFLQSSS